MDNDLYTDPFHTQRPTVKERPPRPHRYSRIPWRSRYTFLSLALVLILGITGVTVFMYQSSASAHPGKHPTKTHNPVPKTHASTPDSPKQDTVPAPIATEKPSTNENPAKHDPAPTQVPPTKAPAPTQVPPTKAPAPTPTPTPRTCPPTIQYGSQGTWVKTLQQKLNTLGWRDQEGKVLLVDGIFGSRTQYAVKNFQAAHAPPVDGVVGPITWSALGYC
jgi:hypothetical protein